MKDEKNIFIIIIAIFLCIVLSRNIYNSIQSYRYRELCNQYTEQLIATEEANRELANTIGRITEVIGRIKETANANVTDARGIIETVEILRSQIQELENCCGSFSQLEYYQLWDSEFGISQ